MTRQELEDGLAFVRERADAGERLSPEERACLEALYLALRAAARQESPSAAERAALEGALTRTLRALPGERCAAPLSFAGALVALARSLAAGAS
jgi:hypothetical protein